MKCQGHVRRYSKICDRNSRIECELCTRKWLTHHCFRFCMALQIRLKISTWNRTCSWWWVSCQCVFDHFGLVLVWFFFGLKFEIFRSNSCACPKVLWFNKLQRFYVGWINFDPKLWPQTFTQIIMDILFVLCLCAIFCEQFMCHAETIHELAESLHEAAKNGKWKFQHF